MSKPFNLMWSDPGRDNKSGAWLEHWQRIVLQYWTAPRVKQKLQQKQPLIKGRWEQCGHYVNAIYLSANTITPINPSQHKTMNWSDFKRWKVHFENRKCRSLCRPKWMNCWQQNSISYMNKRCIKSILQWRFRCMGLRRLPHQNEGNFGCAWIHPDKWQPYGQMLISRVQLSDWSAKSIWWYMLNPRFSINYSKIKSDNYCGKSGLRQPVPEAQWPKYMLIWRLLQMKRVTRR